jgi:SOS-response transcriptional repressor LexA
VNYPSIRIEGGILSPDILDRIEDADGQKPAHFELDSSAKVKNEILRVWADAQHYWSAFQHKIESLKGDSPATTETRNLWVVPLLSLLGYQLEYQARGTELNGKTYPISHRVTNRKQTPLHIIGYREPSGLDRKPEKMTLRMSAHALVQEYLNLSDELYGVVTNGRVLRVLRDSSRLVKLSYLEFDLDRIFTDGLFADFAVLFRLLHATRLPKNEESAASCWLERYHQKSIDEGTRIRDGLRETVTETLEVLGTGFLSDPDNRVLRQQIASGKLRPASYFSYLLRLVYRLLFLMVIEERGLVFPKGVSPKNVALYFQHYSVQRLRRLAVTRGLKVERFHDAWLSLLATFQLFENPVQAAKLGTTAFGGQLFNSESVGPLATCRLSNAALFTALDSLCNFDHPETKQRMPVNFGALATEELGSVYESLLELNPVATVTTPHFGFQQLAGNDRKTTGSYYTPTSLVTCLLDSALDPVLEDRIQNFKTQGFKSVDEAVLALNVCDPACGSGHFLIAAGQRIARRLAILRAGDEEPSPELLRHTLREVIGHCIHGVDVNPMSVELCKVALWLEAVEPGKPLNFLDHHIKCGNSLLGATPEVIKGGIPDAAYEPITGDNKEAAKWMRQLNKEAREGQAYFDFTKAMPWERLGNLPAAVAKLENLDDDTPEALAAKEKLYRDIVQGSGYESARLLHDTWCAAFVWPKESREYGAELTTEHLHRIERNPHSVAPHLKDVVRQLAFEYRFFHWHLEFPAVFGSEGKAGFDVIIGNPPWEKVQLEEKQFFETRRPEVAVATSNARRKLLAALADEDPTLWQEWQKALRECEGEVHLLKYSGRFTFSGKGNLNTYFLFVELAIQVQSAIGRCGLVVPSGIATDDSKKQFFQYAVQNKRLVSLYDFENTNGFFPEVDSRFRFCLLTIAGVGCPIIHGASFVFFARAVEDITISDVAFTLSAEDIKLLNPNTLTCPTFRSMRDAELTKSIYRRVPIIELENQKNSSQWQGESRQMLNITHDSASFAPIALINSLRPNESDSQAILDEKGQKWVRLFEGKMVGMFDHRQASVSYRSDVSYRTTKTESALTEQHFDPHFTVAPQFWVSESRVKQAIPSWYDKKWFVGFKRITSATNERTVIATVLPWGGMIDALPVVYLRHQAALQVGLLANLNSFVLDYVARTKVGGLQLSHFIYKQLPAVVPSSYHKEFLSGQCLIDLVVPRVLELTYTAWDLDPFAQDCSFDGPPFRWDEERRFQLRCELDAAFFHLYLGSDEEWRRQPQSLIKYFPTPRDAVAYIIDTFPIVKRKDEEKFGSYRTKDTILNIYDALAESQRTGRPFVSPLNPPPGPPTDERGHFIPMSQWDPNHWPSHIHPPRDTEREPIPMVAQGGRVTGLDESRVLRRVTPRRNERYMNCVPKLDLKIAAGTFGEDQLPEFQDWVEINTARQLRKGMFVAPVDGPSMEPLIPDGAYCLFQFKAPQLKNDMIAVFQLHGADDPETGGSFTVKRLKLSRLLDSDEGPQRTAMLIPENPAFDPIPVKGDDVKFVAEFLEVLRPLVSDVSMPK